MNKNNFKASIDDQSCLRKLDDCAIISNLPHISSNTEQSPVTDESSCGRDMSTKSACIGIILALATMKGKKKTKRKRVWMKKWHKHRSMSDDAGKMLITANFNSTCCVLIFMLGLFWIYYAKDKPFYIKMKLNWAFCDWK